MTKSPNGAIIYQGPSAIDGTEIVAIVTGLVRKSANIKTGDMLQTWILRVDENPFGAQVNGHDSAVCGACARRPSLAKGNAVAPCYVNTAQAPLSVWRAFNRGSYAPITSRDYANAEGRMLRLGSYGDPAAVPFGAWNMLLSLSIGHTGYTHQWRSCDPRFASVVMASVDFDWEMPKAEARGYRCFRVLNRGDVIPALSARTIQCPASKERGHITNCATCGACSGSGNPKRRFHVAINAH